jgi:EAL domain-containing protein (putative c-di-GMP-specific phosphodiesterase class I)
VLWDDLDSLLELTCQLAPPGTLTDLRVTLDDLTGGAAAAAISAQGDAAAGLRLRVSERTLLEASTAAVGALAAARGYGAGLILTDIGSLATPLVRVGELGFEAVALPPGLVHLLCTGLIGRQRALESAVVVAASFGLAVDAEGIDDPAPLPRLRAAGLRQLEGRALSVRPETGHVGRESER